MATIQKETAEELAKNKGCFGEEDPPVCYAVFEFENVYNNNELTYAVIYYDWELSAYTKTYRITRFLWRKNMQLTKTELKKVAEAVHTMIEIVENRLSFTEGKEWRTIFAKLEIMIREQV